MKTNTPKGVAEDFCGTFSAARLLDLSVATIQTLVERNELSAWKTDGGHRRISMQSILDYQRRHNKMGSLAQTQGARLKVLVIEHHAPGREMIKSIFEQWNLPIDCMVMASGMEALIGISSLHPDVLITDVSMPGVDGFEFLRALRADPSFAALSLLALTDLDECDVAERGGFPEQTIHLKKPLDMNWLNGYFVASLRSVRGSVVLPARSRVRLSSNHFQGRYES